MGKTTKEREFLLTESQTELQLKNYLGKMNMIVGEEYAVLTLSSEYDIKDSLELFTSRFDNIESDDIAFILLRSAILSNDNNYYNEVIKEKVEFGELQDTLYLVRENMGFRKCLTKNIIKQSKKTDVELYNDLDDKNKVLSNLSTLCFYETNLKAKKLEKAFLKVRA